MGGKGPDRVAVDNGGRSAPSTAPQWSPPLSTALLRRGSGDPALARASLSGRGMALAQALAREFDAVGVVNDTVEDGVCESAHASQLLPKPLRPTTYHPRTPLRGAIGSRLPFRLPLGRCGPRPG